MKNKPLRLVTVLTLFGIASSLTAWAIAPAPPPGGHAAQTEEAKRKTLRDLARERDIEVDVAGGENSREYDDLRLLARHAEAIVIGRTLDEESSFDGDDHIVTSYRLDVQRVLKQTQLNAPLRAGQEPPAPLVTPLKFVRPGGVVLVDGRRAARKLKGSEPLKPGRDFLLFLWWSPAHKAYTIAGGMSGAFLIDGEQRLRPLGSETGIRKYDGGGLQAVIDEVLAIQ